MKSIKITLIVFLGLLTSCLDDNDNGNGNIVITGTGPIVEESRTVASFNSILASIPGNLYITLGAPQELRIKTHSNLFIELKTEVESNVLEIGFDRSTRNIDTLDIFITTPDLSSIVFSGAGNIVGENDFILDDLNIVISGVGNTFLNGQIDEFRYTLSGVGDLFAFDLVTTESFIVISGVGNAQITATTTLDVVISGQGNVLYKGSPAITSSISGTGSIIDSN